jgi:hypothetical protein
MSLTSPAIADFANPARRVAALSPDGESAAILGEGGLDWVAIESGARSRLACPPPVDLAFSASGLWVLAADRLLGFRAADELAVDVAVRGERLALDGDAAVVGARRVGWDGSMVAVSGGAVPLGVMSPGLFGFDEETHLVARDVAGHERGRIPIPDRVALEVQPIFAGRLSAAWIRARADGPQDEIWVFRPSGALVHRLEVPRARLWAIAGERGSAVVLDETGELHLLCLRMGRVLRSAPAPLTAPTQIEVDGAGTAMLVVGCPTKRPFPVIHAGLADVFSGSGPAVDPGEEREPDRAAASDAAESSRPISDAGRSEARLAPMVPEDLDVAAFAPPGGRSSFSAAERRRFLEPEIAYLRAVAGRGVAGRWLAGVLSGTGGDRFPHEVEVIALAGAVVAPLDPEALVERIEELDALVSRAAESREEARRSADPMSPMAELVGRFGLSTTELGLLVAAAAPRLDAAVRRLYGVATGQGGWATESLLEELLSVADPEAPAREAIDRLVAAGLLAIGTAEPRSIEPASAVIELLEAGPGASPSPGDIRRYWIPEAAWDQLRESLSRGSSLHLALRGRPGRGRRVLADHLVRRAKNQLHVIELDRLGEDVEAELASELSRARILGTVPCLVGFEARGEGGRRLSRTIASFEEPLFACIDEDTPSPLELGATVIELGRLGESERRALWGQLLGDDQAEVAASLAGRFHIPPATAIQVAERTGGGVAPIERALKASLGEALRSLADRVEELPTWDQVILPEEIADSLGELIARHRHFERVVHAWGLSSALRSARGAVALFSGAPGTGKTLAAGLVARELGRDLYRVDVSRIVSKWLGETEKQLAAVFDAAEQADAVLLFDEADSLFAKRSEVKSSNDRYANLETGYLLQRLDTFRGVAILTTNHGSAIDPAFRRRLTTQLTFPFPDEDTREKLWRAHLPPKAPVAGELDFATLAKDYPLSGGSIRNIAVRAAFLAAGEGAPLSQSHYERAIRLEYRERGKLSPSGRLE